VSRGDIWIHARAVGLSPSEAEESTATENADDAVGPRLPNITSSTLGSILDDAFTVLESTPRQTISRPAPSGEQCDTIVRPALGDAFVGAEVFGGPMTLSGDALLRGFTAFDGAMGFASAERLGYLECGLALPGSSGSVQLVVARGASWVVEDPWAVDLGGATVDGDVTSGCAITGECWAFAVVGDDLLVAEAASYGDETLAVRLITAMTLTR